MFKCSYPFWPGHMLDKTHKALDVLLFCRELSWHDVAFYNADLYEGLRRMIRDVESEKNSVEDFKATYCCYFEVGLYGFTEPECK